MESEHSMERIGPRELRPVGDESTRELVSDLLHEGRQILREEARLLREEAERLKNDGRETVDEARRRVEEDVRLAKRELVANAKRGARAGGVMAAGGVLAHAALYLLL